MTLILSIMLASCFVDDTVLVVAVSGAELTTFEATVLVAVFDEGVGAADVTTCCWVEVADDDDALAVAVTGPAVDEGGVAVVMVEF